MRLKAAGLAVIAMAGGLAAAQAPPSQTAAPEVRVPVRPTWFGQIDDRDPQHVRLAYPGTGFEFRFRGAGAQMQVSSTSDTSALTVVVDHGAPELRLLKKGENTVDLLAVSEVLTQTDLPHTVLVMKRNETWQGILTVNGITLAPGAQMLDPIPLPVRRILFIGDSVTCGEGVDNNATCTKDPALPASNAYESYGMLLGRRLDADTHLVCYGGRGVERDYRGLGIADNVVNAPEFFNLALASDEPAGRVPWDTARWQPELIFISLGTNDFNLEKTKPLDEKKWVGEYVVFLTNVRASYPHALIVLTEGAIVTNPLLRQLVQQTAAVTFDTRVVYTPSEHYPGNGCNGHPIRPQHIRMADDFEPVLRKLLGW
jgi:lysophospholipase L1-like esterase